LERIRGHPPETASINFEAVRSMTWVMVSFTVPAIGSSSITQHEYP